MATKTATCPVCQRGPFKLTKTGKLGHHGHNGGRGWRTIGGMATARCYGAGAAPANALREAIATLDYYIDSYTEIGATGIVENCLRDRERFVRADIDRLVKEAV